MLFIQGAGLHGAGWEPQVSELSTSYTCATFDNRGMGRSQPHVGALTIEQMAADAVAIMDALGWESAHVVGHSMGGLIAQHLAVSARTRVRSLALLCTFPRGGDATKLTPWMLWTGLRTRIGTRRQRRHAFLEMVLTRDELAAADKDVLAAQLEPIFGHDLADQPAIVMKQLSAMSAYDATPLLAGLAGLPTLVLSATHDRLAPPASGRAIAAGIAGARFVEWTDAAHGVPITQAARVNELLREHFARD